MAGYVVFLICLHEIITYGACIDGSMVQVLKRVQNDDDSEQITEWLAGARDSLMKKYVTFICIFK